MRKAFCLKLPALLGLLMLGCLSHAQIDVSAGLPCHPDSLVSYVGGFTGISVDKPQHAKGAFDRALACYQADQAFPLDVLFDLGTAHINSQRQLDSIRFGKLMAVARTVPYRRGYYQLRYQELKRRDVSAKVHQQAYAALMDSMAMEAHPAPLVSALIEWRLLQAYAKNRQEEATWPSLQRALRWHEASGNVAYALVKGRSFVERLSIEPEYCTIADRLLDTLEVYAASVLPDELPAFYGTRGYIAYTCQGRDTALALFEQGASACLDQLSTGYVCADCIFPVANHLLLNVLQRKSWWEAGPYLDAMATYLNVGDFQYQGAYLFLQGCYHVAMGKYTEAHVFLDRADALFKRIYGPGNSYEGNIRSQRILAYDRQGKTMECLRLSRTAADLAASDRDYRNVNRTWANMAIVYTNHGWYDSALALYSTDRFDFAKLPNNAFHHALALNRNGQFAESNAVLNRPWAVPTIRNERIKHAILKADNALQSGRSDVFRINLQEAQQLLDASGLPGIPQEGALDVLALEAKVALNILSASPSEGKADAAQALMKVLQEWQAHLTKLERLGQNPQSLQSAYAALKAVQLAVLNQDGLDEAQRLEVLMNANAHIRSRTLKQRLRQSARMTLAERQTFEGLQARVQVRLQEAQEDTMAWTSMEERGFMSDVERLQAVRDSLMQQVLGGPAETSLWEDHEALLAWCRDQHTQLLSYLVGDSSMYVLYCNQERLTINPLPIEALEDIRRISDALKRAPDEVPQGENMHGQSWFELGALLLPEELKKHNGPLVILPDGPLHQFPMELLGLGNGQQVLDQFDVRYAYHLEPPTHTERAPSKGHSLFVAFAPSYRALMDSLQPADRPFLFAQNKALIRNCVPLANNGVEARELARILKGQALLGDQATEGRLRESLETHNIVLFSGHAFAVPSQAALSGLVLGQGLESKNSAVGTHPVLEASNDDGILHAFEAQFLTPQTELLILSACQTGEGKLVEGEGPMALARYFQASGIPSVLVSLWSIDDASTLELMAAFAEGLKGGMGKAEALANAKRHFRSKHPDAAPYYWAGLVLIGDDAPTHPQGRTVLPFWGWFLLVVGVATGSWLAFGRRGRQDLQPSITEAA